MKIRRVVPDNTSTHPEKTRDFYVGLLGFQVVMDMGWVMTLASKSNPTAQITIQKRDDGNAVQPDMSIEVDDVDAAYRTALKNKLRIVYPIRDEEWGVRRFFVEDPDGKIVNVLSHGRE